MAGWHHQLNGHEFEQAPRVVDGQGGLACCKESHTTEQLTELNGTEAMPTKICLKIRYY